LGLYSLCVNMLHTRVTYGSGCKEDPRRASAIFWHLYHTALSLHAERGRITGPLGGRQQLPSEFNPHPALLLSSWNLSSTDSFLASESQWVRIKCSHLVFSYWQFKSQDLRKTSRFLDPMVGRTLDHRGVHVLISRSGDVAKKK
jgi:hypothetical protein